ncbi:MAG: hypothetical protein U5K75_11135 [Ahrensia sp.]|nr:hypothetical protein [Ahrensia sp.]
MSMIGDEYFPTSAEVARDRESAVDPHNWTNCENCDGKGVLCDGHANDPDSGVSTCDDCSGEGGYEWECKDCGNTVITADFDCIACDLVGALPAKGLDHAAIVKGIAAALNKGVQS